MDNPDLDPTPEARIAMMIWSNAYAYGRLGSMGFWNSLPTGRKNICTRALAAGIIADQGVHWAVVAAMCAAKTNHDPRALKAIRDWNAEQKRAAQ